ncbi:hypothetical protein CBR_g54653 [Chara braunii]|uniref:Uncharacterized protein n=1 Tax=Chara braunii TaxID=69332 RepID=A0A388MCB6_CHABU|nr:hypothetical protein CBR_g54653 [Chara braunii]|eukprot:GBG92208.1 hypothetical protein CBR_g54653 [Chara braunii]
MRSGFRDFAREIVTHIGGEVKQLRDNVGKFCENAIQGAKAIAAVEGESRPPKKPVKLKFPDAYGGKKEENFDNWEASVDNYIYLQHILIEEQVLVAFQALKDEAASFARSLASAARCENNLVAYSKVTPLSKFLKLLKERFADPTRGVRASDKLQTIHSWQWRSAKALKGTIDDLVAVPDHGVTKPQLVQLFYRVMPEALHGHFFDKSQQAGITYDALSREVVLYESKSMPVDSVDHGYGAQVDSVEHGYGAQVNSVDHGYGAQVDSVDHGYGAQVDNVDHCYGAQVDSVDHDYGPQVDNVDNGYGAQLSDAGRQRESRLWRPGRLRGSRLWRPRK